MNHPQLDLQFDQLVIRLYHIGENPLKILRTLYPQYDFKWKAPNEDSDPFAVKTIVIPPWKGHTVEGCFVEVCEKRTDDKGMKTIQLIAALKCARKTGLTGDLVDQIDSLVISVLYYEDGTIDRENIDLVRKHTHCTITPTDFIESPDLCGKIKGRFSSIDISWSSGIKVIFKDVPDNITYHPKIKEQSIYTHYPKKTIIKEFPKKNETIKKHD